MATNEQIIADVKERGVIDFKYILIKSKNKKQFKQVLHQLKISNSDVNRFIANAEPYESKLRR